MSRSAVRVRSSALQKYPDLQDNRSGLGFPAGAPRPLYTNPYTNWGGLPLEGVFRRLGNVLVSTLSATVALGATSAVQRVELRPVTS